MPRRARRRGIRVPSQQRGKATRDIARRRPSRICSPSAASRPERSAMPMNRSREPGARTVSASTAVSIASANAWTSNCPSLVRNAGRFSTKPGSSAARPAQIASAGAARRSNNSRSTRFSSSGPRPAAHDRAAPASVTGPVAPGAITRRARRRGAIFPGRRQGHQTRRGIRIGADLDAPRAGTVPDPMNSHADDGMPGRVGLESIFCVK